MTPELVIKAAEAGSLEQVEGADPLRCTAYRGFLSVAGLVAIPIEATSSVVDTSGDLELRDEDDIPVGTICFTKRLTRILPQELTRWQFVAYLADALPEDLGAPYDFRKNYVVIDIGFVDVYLEKYGTGSPLWGGFTHTAVPPKLTPSTIAFIKGDPAFCLPTRHHTQALNRYVEATNAFDRFLKLYHTLELLFDYVVMKRVRAVGDDLEQFGQIMNDFERPEVDRLKGLIRDFCDQPENLAKLFPLMLTFQPRVTEIFQSHTKKGNPVEAQARWDKLCALLANGQTTDEDFISANLKNRDLSYGAFVAGLASYWIYRVRSSIAHSRVGEFLFLDADELFVAKFAEPLLLAIVRQVFANANLKALADA